jgi:hypothetical protein
MSKYSQEEIIRAINNCPNWMRKTIISDNGKVFGEYKFETKEMNILTYNDSLRRKLYDFDACYLRDAVWSLEMKMGLIWSICHDIRLPSFWLAEHSEDASKCDIIDAKNRSIAIYEFFNNDFPIFIEVDGKEQQFFWQDIEKCTPPEPKSTKKLTDFQERLKNLNMTIRNYTISVNKVSGCSVLQRAELSAILSKCVSWTVEEELFNFNWRSKSLFKFLFKFCFQETRLSNNITNKAVSNNKRDKGSIFVGKVLWLLYGDFFKDNYSDRGLGNNIKSYKKEEKKSPFVKYFENLNKIILEFIEKQNTTRKLECSKDCEELFEFIGSDFDRIISLKKTCKLLNDIIMIHGITKKLDANDMLDTVVQIERRIQQKIFTHAMLKNQKEKFYNLIKLYREKKDEAGDKATSQSTTDLKIKYRSELFEKCLKELDFDLGIKNKGISKKQRENAIWESNGFDPISKEKLLDEDLNCDHGDPKSLSSRPGKITILSSQSNLLKSNLTPKYSKDISDFMN